MLSRQSAADIMRQQIVRFRLQKELGEKEMKTETETEKGSERNNANETETGSKLLIEY